MAEVRCPECGLSIEARGNGEAVRLCCPNCHRIFCAVAGKPGNRFSSLMAHLRGRFSKAATAVALIIGVTLVSQLAYHIGVTRGIRQGAVSTTRTGPHTAADLDELCPDDNSSNGPSGGPLELASEQASDVPRLQDASADHARPRMRHTQWSSAVTRIVTSSSSRRALAEACWKLGLSYGRYRRFEQAATALKAATRLDSANAKACFDLGRTYLLLGQDTKALEAFQSAVERSPADGAHYLGLGWALKELARYEDARDAYEQAVQLDPDEPWARLCLGDAFAMLKQHAQAIEAYEAAVRLDPSGQVGLLAKKKSASMRAALRPKAPTKAAEDPPGLEWLTKHLSSR